LLVDPGTLVGGSSCAVVAPEAAGALAAAGWAFVAVAAWIGS
jgi:hypothetical protein